MKVVTGWRLDEEKIVLSSIDEESGETVDIELPNTIYEQVIVEGPPSPQKRIREMLDKIYEIRKKRLLFIDKILEGEENLRDELQKARKALMKTNDKFEVNKWKAVMQSISKEKVILQEYRYIVKLTYQEEGNLRAKLLKLGSV